MAQTTANAPQATDVNVYPNPANNELFINAGNYQNLTFELYDVVGKLIVKQNISTTQSINTSKIAEGIYTYKVYDGNAELKLGKIVITH